jgi:chemotaxis protein methyltransferase CheR
MPPAVLPPPPLGEQALAISPSGFRRVAEFITRELGIRMSPAKIPLLQSRLQRRLRALGCPSLEDYLHSVLQAAEGEAEVLEFIDAVTTNKTDFFREPQHFEFLTRTVLPTLDACPSDSWTLRVWSAGCSSGQEVYTLAMVLSEYGESQFDYRILGTDVSSRVLRAAETAIYEAAIVEPVPPVLRRKYLLRSRDPAHAHVRVGPELRTRVRFERLNFMAHTYAVGDTFDVIFFRNVMIYFDKPTQERVVNRLCERLRPGGYLFVGHSESLSSLNVPLQAVASAVYQRT